MTLAYIYDRTRPLAERVQDAIDAIICERDWGNTTEAEEAALSEVIADIAAADRLARADVGYWDWVGGDSCEWGVSEEHVAALDAYRARMAQGVADA